MEDVISIIAGLAIALIIAVIKSHAEKKQAQKPISVDFDDITVPSSNAEKKEDFDFATIPPIPYELPEEGIRVSKDDIEEEPMVIKPKNPIRRLANNRWRQAIIDSEILTPKFKQEY